MCKSETPAAIASSCSFTHEKSISCLRNVVSMFNVIEKEMQWRENQGLPKGFDTMRKCKPVVAVGAKEPLNGQTMLADYYRSFLSW